MKKLIPIGISDFKQLISSNYYYVDKTLLIKDIEESGQAIQITRPRGFGKTLNLSMLLYFFEKSEDDHASLFTNSAIWAHAQFRGLQGQFPVIMVSFKTVCQTSYEAMFDELGYVIAQEYERLSYVVSALQTYEIERFNKIRTQEELNLGSSLEFLAHLLHKYHKQNVIILIDDYDVPARNAFIHGFYDRIALLLQDLLIAALKDNKILAKGVITGSLSISMANIFGGLNNLDVIDLTNLRIADKFGFTDHEVETLWNITS